MNSDQIEIVLQYLKIETNYAVIINGEYGVGKTHFYKKELIPEIQKVPLSTDGKKFFIPIHISLFGYKTLEEIQTAIFVELFPILKSKGLKLAAGIGKSIIRGIAQIAQAGEIDKYIGDMNLDAGDWLKYDELVICFDDLDRRSEALDLIDVFGFINSLVENQGAKILILANEAQLIKDANYSSSLREKVIGVSIQYKPDPKTVYNQIISERYSSSNKVYYEFLFKNGNDIIKIVELNKNNFRNLIFFLEHFKTIFYPIEVIFQNEKEFAILKEEKLKAILDFTLAISIEYKLGLMNSTNLEDVKVLNDETLTNLFIERFNQTKKTENETDKISEPGYIEIFKNKYFSKNKYYFFKSIFEYIIGAKAFQVNDLRAELEGYFIIKDGEIPEYEKILIDLSYLGCLRLSDKEYRRLTMKMLSYVDSGTYQLRQYGTVFHFATRFNNILSFNLDKLKTQFKKGINKGKIYFPYTDNLDFYMSVDQHVEFKDDVIEVVKFCLEINNNLKKNKVENELEKLFDLFLKDFNAFNEKIGDKNSKFYFTSFWLEFNINKIYNRINKLENDQIWDLGNYFVSRYRKNIFDGIYPEKVFVIELRKLIDNQTIKRRRKNLHNASLDYLSKCLKDCVSNFPEKGTL